MKNKPGEELVLSRQKLPYDFFLVSEDGGDILLRNAG
jgi:hypothetical protein